MTKISILGKDFKEKKSKIVFEGCLMEGCDDVNYDSFESDFLTPSDYKEIVLICKNYGTRDVMLAIKHDGEKIIMFGHFNDGVV